MKDLLKNGYHAKRRPSGHDISKKFSTDNGAAIPPNLIAIAHTESNSHYLRYCKDHDIKPHPARFPAELPEYFIRMLSDSGDFVLDPFAGSCVTGEVAERTGRKWVCVELIEDYLKGAMARFCGPKMAPGAPLPEKRDSEYKLSNPAALWNGADSGSLPEDGGKTRPLATKKRANAARRK
jgi:site-specific DNA-methyltransferase (cytosine-N4-specific)